MSLRPLLTTLLKKKKNTQQIIIIVSDYYSPCQIHSCFSSYGPLGVSGLA